MPLISLIFNMMSMSQTEKKNKQTRCCLGWLTNLPLIFFAGTLVALRAYLLYLLNGWVAYVALSMFLLDP
jgi:hypothetical protein